MWKLVSLSSLWVNCYSLQHFIHVKRIPPPKETRESNIEDKNIMYKCNFYTCRN
uniref:Uncharacterized protein n=1 Tax=Arundo donax TaxID=35708 RepID=A0A0A8ZXN4_ARUDO